MTKLPLTPFRMSSKALYLKNKVILRQKTLLFKQEPPSVSLLNLKTPLGKYN